MNDDVDFDYLEVLHWLEDHLEFESLVHQPFERERSLHCLENIHSHLAVHKEVER